MATTYTPHAAPGYANDPAKLDACNAWVDAARPIIRALLVLDDEADGHVTTAWLAERHGKRWNAPATANQCSYSEARDIVRKAIGELRDMLEGIRDSFICDEMAGRQQDDAAQDEADAFNDWLSDETISVSAAIDRVAEERIA